MAGIQLKIDMFDFRQEGVWRYETGPLAGTVVARGNHPDVQPVLYAPWSGGEPNEANYMGEDVAEVYVGTGNPNAIYSVWSDRESILVLEYGTCANDIVPCPDRMVCVTNQTSPQYGNCVCAPGLFGDNCESPCICPFSNTTGIV